MSTRQEYWDMALVKAWRAEQTIGDAIKLFESITGLKLADIQPRLLRTPVGYVQFKMGARAYVSTYLMDINDWFWDCAPGKEVELFKDALKPWGGQVTEVRGFFPSTSKTAFDKVMELIKSK